MTSIMKWYICILDSLIDRTRVFAYLVYFMGFIMLYEVIARYLFNSPTIWAWDINVQLECLFTVVAGGYALLEGAHIRSDLFYARWTKKKQAWVNIFTSFLPFFFLVAALVSAYKAASRSVVLKAHAMTPLAPPVYPIKIVIVIGVFLFLLQLISEIFQSVLTVVEKSDSEGKK